MKNLTYYQTRKESLVSLIREHSENCLRYLDYESVKHMKVNDLQRIYDYDDTMIDVYTQELLVLEANKIIGWV